MKMRAITAIAAATGMSAILGVTQPVCAAEISQGDIKNLQQLVLRQQEQINIQAAQIRMLNEKLDSVLGKTEQNSTAIAAKADKQEVENLQTEAMVVSNSLKWTSRSMARSTGPDSGRTTATPARCTSSTIISPRPGWAWMPPPLSARA